MRTLEDIMRPEDNNFALLRLAAASSVVVSHSFHLATGDALAQPLAGITRYNLGQHAVHVFFVLSGIMIAGSLERSRSLVSFALARFFRVIPGLAVCALVTAFVLGPVVSSLSLSVYFASPAAYIYPAQVTALAKVSAALPGVFDSNPVPVIVNESLWTLKFEVLCYAILALLAAAGAWRSNRAYLVVAAASILVFGPISAARIGPSGATLVDNVARLWLCFLLGVSLYRYRAGVPLSWPALAGIAAVWWAGRGTGAEPVLTFILAGYGAVMVAALPAGTWRAWANRTDLSYGMYIYGWPTGQALVWAFPGIGPAALALLSLALTGFMGWLSWTWVERSSLRARTPLAQWLGRASSRELGVSEMSPPEPIKPAV